MNLVPSIPKGSFGRSHVGRDGVPNRLLRVFFYRSHSICIHNFIHYFTLYNVFYLSNSDFNFIFRTTDLLKLV